MNNFIINILLQMRGHKLAQLDPLGISSADLDSERPEDLTFKFYNFRKNCTIEKQHNLTIKIYL